VSLPITAPAGPVAVSACLLGKPCRYNGQSHADPAVIALGEERKLVPICPETLGGLPTPRPAAEIVTCEDGTRKVVDSEGSDITPNYADGAARALSVALDAQCGCAVLCDKSPSCGYGRIFDGTFSNTVIPGNGIAAQLFIDADIPVFLPSELV
jgi:uncharacterized protein YbbK (DUF523 family)